MTSAVHPSHRKQARQRIDIVAIHLFVTMHAVPHRARALRGGVGHHSQRARHCRVAGCGPGARAARVWGGLPPCAPGDTRPRLQHDQGQENASTAVQKNMHAARSQRAICSKGSCSMRFCMQGCSTIRACAAQSLAAGFTTYLCARCAYELEFEVSCVQTDFLFERRLNEHLYNAIAEFSKGAPAECCIKAPADGHFNRPRGSIDSTCTYFLSNGAAGKPTLVFCR